jgi:hypothetical protein
MEKGLEIVITAHRFQSWRFGFLNISKLCPSPYAETPNPFVQFSLVCRNRPSPLQVALILIRQLAKLPARQGEHDFTDYPHDAEEYSVNLQGGDIILAFVRFMKSFFAL